MWQLLFFTLRRRPVPSTPIYPTTNPAGFTLQPATVPAETQSVEFDIIMDDTNPPAFRAFTSAYCITGQDVSIYEQATKLHMFARISG